MKKLAIILAVATLFPAFAQAQEYTALQRYLFDQSGYAPPELGYAQPQSLESEQGSYDTAYAAPYGYEYEERDAEPVIMSLEDF